MPKISLDTVFVTFKGNLNKKGIFKKKRRRGLIQVLVTYKCGQGRREQG